MSGMLYMSGFPELLFMWALNFVLIGLLEPVYSNIGKRHCKNYVNPDMYYIAIKFNLKA